MTANVMRLNVVWIQGKWPYFTKTVVTESLIMKTKGIITMILLHSFSKAMPQQDMPHNMDSMFPARFFI